MRVRATNREASAASARIQDIQKYCLRSPVLYMHDYMYVYTYSSYVEARIQCLKVVLYVIRKKPAKNVLVTKYTYKSVRANTRARNVLGWIFSCALLSKVRKLVRKTCWATPPSPRRNSSVLPYFSTVATKVLPEILPYLRRYSKILSYLRS